MSSPAPILVRTHRTCGVRAWSRLFRSLCQTEGLVFRGDSDPGSPPPRPGEVWFPTLPDPDRMAIPAGIRGVHVVRDPRDVLVRLALAAGSDGDGSLEMRLLHQMERAGRSTIRSMLAWQRRHPQLMRIHIEDLEGDRYLRIFHDVLVHLGFVPESIPRMLQRVCENRMSFRVWGRPAASRPTWRDVYSEDLKRRFEARFGEAVAELGYDRLDGVGPSPDSTRDARTPPYLSPVILQRAGRSCIPSPENPVRQLLHEQPHKDLYKWQHYFDLYHEHFERLRHREGIRILEIGVWRGGSLRMWRRYFERASLVLGIDLDEKCRGYEEPARGIHVRIGDQSDPRFLARIVEEFSGFDIVIDDGGHTTSQQIASFELLYPHVSENGVYLVEDTHSNCWDRFRDHPEGLTFLDLARSLVDRLHEPYQKLSVDRFDPQKEGAFPPLEVSTFYATTQGITFHDSIVVFRKGVRTYPSQVRY